MTTEAFFSYITARGLEPTLQLLASQSPEGELQMKRLEGLSNDLKLGLVTLANAAITRNRIALGILSLLDDAGGDGVAHSKLSEILRDYLEVSETEEVASKVTANAEHEQIEQNLKKYRQELSKLDLSPVPESSLATLEDIRKMVASSQMELALRHTLTLTAGTDFFKKTENLVERYKQLSMQKKLNVISFEEATLEENRFAEALLQILGSFEQDSDQIGNGYWVSIRKWFNRLRSTESEAK